MAIPILSNVDFSQNQLITPVFQQAATNPTNPAPVKGQFYYNSSTNLLQIFNGSVWTNAGLTGATGAQGPAGASVVTMSPRGTSPNTGNTFDAYLTVNHYYIYFSSYGDSAGTVNLQLAQNNSVIWTNSFYFASGWQAAGWYVVMLGGYTYSLACSNNMGTSMYPLAHIV